MIPKATHFHFRNYDFDKKSRKATFEYEVVFSKASKQDPIIFTEHIEFPRGNNNLSKEELDVFLQPLFLVLGVSYYKLYFPKKITIPFDISKEQADFWNTLYKKGLGEFMYKNKLDPKNIAKFPYSKGNKQLSIASIKTSNHVLLGIGGGKDSTTAAELLKENNISSTSFLIETKGAYSKIDMVLKAIGNPVVRVNRILDEKLFSNLKGSMQGHIPLSATYAFIGLFAAALYGHRYIAVGNGYSSNFGSIKYKGLEINHGWSKSLEFEEMMQNYTEKFITKDIKYFSVLRQFYEIRIVEMFAKYKKYHSIFTSCNKNFYIDKEKSKTMWCGECSKCAFNFLMLSAFLSKTEVVGIFGKNLFADKDLLPIFKDLLGIGDMKPFDCVGTFEESKAALYLSAEKFGDDLAVKTLLPKVSDAKDCVDLVFDTMPARTLPTLFRLLGIKNLCILGYGREGKATEKYLKNKYPKLKIDILDKEDDKEYLLKQKYYDLAVKTPGIRKSEMIIPYITATNLFFSSIDNLTIGVTGTKGKSTTSTLIYEILKEAGKDVYLIGNIGNPMLKVLSENKIKSDTIFVVELSSYQLEDVEYSPNIAVLLNIYEGHSEAHGGFEEYKKAKENIFKFQKSNDVFFGEPFSTTLPLKLKKSEIALVGKHNVKNINAAVKVAKHLKISDIKIKKAVKNFKPLSHRLEKVGTFNGIDFYDDAISTTPDSSIAAIEALKKVDTIFLGGSKQKFDFSKLEKTIRKAKIRNVVLFPDNGKKMLKSRKGLNVVELDNMYDAVDFAFENTKKGKICLLSTATQSFSVWNDMFEKGEEFQRAVRKYKSEKH